MENLDKKVQKKNSSKAKLDGNIPFHKGKLLLESVVS